ncbi:uncharacterized protein LOC114335019 [Diabrotica virgifera virgifera]|uniref:Uncharacterized protein LOC114335019 n=1 Tax=Diabrotica virgifera virgifera TaxID=50390 RepID=A0A6P7FWR4_DIAVI|nr:uncharacterized protein LOC114335019 [Diabrotica virgifera virgifera]
MENEILNILNKVPDYIEKVGCDTTNLTSPFKCAVKSCPNRFVKFDNSGKLPYKFHRFPANIELSKVWKVNCGWKEYDDVDNLMVCSNHFNLDDYIRNYKEEFTNPNFKRQLSAKAVPQLNLGPNKDKPTGSRDVEFDTNEKYVQMILDEDQIKADIESTKLAENSLKLRNKELVNKLASLEQERILLETLIRSKSTSIMELQTNLKRKRHKEIILRKTFSEAQIKLLHGKKVVWSDDDLATAFTIRHMGSKKCYLYLKNVLKLPLPALSYIQAWAAHRAKNV